MDEYIVSARKYRPLSFDAVVGQQALTTTLKNAVKSGKLAHAYLFVVHEVWVRLLVPVSLRKLLIANTLRLMVRLAMSVKVARLSAKDAVIISSS